jgi:hypothetical protein
MLSANWLIGIAATAMIIGVIAVALLILLMATYLGLRSRLQALRSLLMGLSQLGSLLRSIASSLDLAAQAAQGAGQSGVSAGNALMTVGSTLDTIRVPTGQLQVRNLWESGVPNPLHLGPVYVLTEVSLGTRPLLPQDQNLVNRAAVSVSNTAQALGPPPSAAGTLSAELKHAAQVLRQVAQLTDAIHP